MKKMNWKKWLVVVGVVLALCLIVVFAACGRKPDPTEPTTVPTTTVEPTTGVGNVTVPTTTVPPTTMEPTTAGPTTEPTTVPTTEAPTTVPPTTEPPATEAPTDPTEPPTEAPTVPETTVHVHNLKEIVVPATCTEEGTRTKVCDCGYEFVLWDAALGHDYGDWVITKEPTVEETGKRERTCKRCGGVEKDFVAPLDAETGEKYESFIDPRVDIWELPDSVSYSYVHDGMKVVLTDYRTWGETPSVYIEEDGSLRIIYFQKNGTKVTKIISPMAEHTVNGVIYDSGNFKIIEFSSLG